MSKEAVIALFKASREDPALNAQLEAVDSPTTIVKLAREQGYEFDEAEYTAIEQEMRMQNYKELEDNQLKSVSGGTTKPPDRTDMPLPRPDSVTGRLED